MGNYSKAGQNGTHAEYFPVSGYTPGPLGWNDPSHPDDKLCSASFTPGPLGFGHDVCSPDLPPIRPPIQIACFSLRKVYAFLRSVSIAIEQERRIKIVWKEYKESKALNVLYKVLFWKGTPGWVEVEPGDIHQILEAAGLETERRMQIFLEKCEAGPQAVGKYLSVMEEVRTSALKTVADVYHEANDLNAQIRREVAMGLQDLALLKFGADLFITFASLAAGKAGDAIDLGYGLVATFVQDKDGLDYAQVVALEAGEAIGDQTAEKAEKKLLEGDYDDKVKQLKREVRRLQDELRRKTSPAKIKKLQRQIGLKKSAAKMAGKTSTRLGKLVAGGTVLKVVFIAAQVKASYDDFQEVWDEAEKDIH